MAIPVQGLAGAALREAVTEFKAIIDAVREALKAKLRSPENPDPWPCIEAIWPDRAVVEWGGKYWQYPYAIDDAGNVALGDPVAVVEEFRPVAAAMTEGVLIEAAAPTADAPKGTVWAVRVIRAGASINGNYYPDAVLREAVALFEGARIMDKPDLVHVKGQGKHTAAIIGQLRHARFVEGRTPDSGEIRAEAHLLESSGLPAKLVEMWDRKMTSTVGFSIDADGMVKRRGKLREAVSITKVKSLDFIVEPSAGGEIINLLEAVQEPSDMALRERMIEAVKAQHGGRLPANLNPDDDAALETAYREAVAPAPATSGTSFAAAPAADVLALQARLDQAEMREAIAASGLPAAVQDKLRKRMSQGTPASLREAIADEAETLARLTEAGHVVGLGDGRVEGGEDRSDKVRTMFDDFFDLSKRVMSFRECYVEATGDRGVTGLIRNCDPVRLREAVGVELREAVSAATFDDILGNSITRAMVREYSAAENYRDWRDLVDVVPIRDFRSNERPRMGGYGNLPAVAENAAYGALTTPTDEKATYSIGKYGGTETISIETIANDDVGLIRRIPQRLGVAAARTLYEFILDFLRTNPTIYDTVALFHATHGNLGATALSAASFAAARLAMKKQAEKDSAKRLGLILRHVYVPSDLEETAFDLFVRSTNNDETFVQSRKPRVHVVDYWTDANDWCATADKAETPLIEVGFYSGMEEPELFVQDQPTQGSLFSNDQVKYKIRHIYGGNVLDYRGLYKAVVA